MPADSSEHVAKAVVAGHFLVVLSCVVTITFALAASDAPTYNRAANYLRVVKSANLPAYDVYLAKQRTAESRRLQERVARIASNYYADVRYVTNEAAPAAMLRIDDTIGALPAITQQKGWISRSVEFDDNTLATALGQEITQARQALADTSKIDVLLQKDFGHPGLFLLRIKSVAGNVSYSTSKPALVLSRPKEVASLGDWLDTFAAGQRFALYLRGGQLPDDIIKVWPSIADRSLDDAIQYLDRRGSESASVNVAGINLSQVVQPWIMQFVTGALLLYLIAGLNQLGRVSCRTDAGIWIGTYSNFVARFLTFATLTCLPVGAQIAYIYGAYNKRASAAPEWLGKDWFLNAAGMLLVVSLSIVCAFSWRTALRNIIPSGRRNLIQWRASRKRG